MDVASLRSLLASLAAAVPDSADALHDSELDLYLPADDRGIRPQRTSAAGVILHVQRVTVPAVRVDTTLLPHLLEQLASDQHTHGTADSVLFVRQLVRYVLRQIARGRFYPDLDHPRGGDFRAVWRLAGADEADSSTLAALVNAMPPVVRAVVDDSVVAAAPATAAASAPTEATVLDAAHVVDQMTAHFVDVFVRHATATDDFFDRVHTLAATADASPDVRWVSALLSDDARLSGTPEEASHTFSIVRQWSGRLDEHLAAAPWRLTFRLEEPETSEDFNPENDLTDGIEMTWKLILQLQAPGEDGVLVDAEELWGAAADSSGLFGRSLPDRRAQLLADLKRAAEICPVLLRLIDEPTPAELDLSTAEAHLLMRQWANELSLAGFGISLPEFAARAEGGLGLMLEVNPPDGPSAEDLLAIENGLVPGRGKSVTLTGGRFGLESLLEFNWQIAVGSMRLTLDEFRKLTSRSSPLLRYRGKWMQMDVAAAAKAIEFLEKQSAGGSLTLGQALRAAYGATSTETGLPVLGLAGTSWIEQLLSQAPGAAYAQLPQPASFKGELRPYQLRGLQWLAFLDRLGLGGCLADDMGLGKTIQLIALMLHEREQLAANNPASRPVGPTLLFAPTSVLGNWVKELQRFAPSLTVLIHHGPTRLTGEAFATTARQRDVVLTSYALAYRDAEMLKTVQWHRVAVDEAQKIKNASAAASQAIRSIPAGRHIGLTGTPIENHLAELWSIMELLNPGLLGSSSDFRERFALPIEKGGDRQRAAQLRSLIRPFVLRRLKSDPQVAGDLPEKMEMKVFCNLTSEQAAMYERITAEMLGQIDSATGIRRRGLILAALTRLKQICDHPALLSDEAAVDIRADLLEKRSGKSERLIEMLEEVLEEKDAALIFTQYREMGHLLEKQIKKRLGAQVMFLHGGTPARSRDAMIDRFQAPGSDVKIFILSLRAGGLGLNLTAANHVFHYDRWWNPAVEQQATDRAHRIGQTRKVQVHQFVCVGTLEERIDKLLTDKLALADQIVGSGEDWLTDLSTDQLRQYLQLSQDAVAED
jgi:superfamily II DNA or RNA helicase